MKITAIRFYHFEPIYVIGELTSGIKKQIQEILNNMSFSEYAGYHPDEQNRRKAIEELVKDMKKPDIETLFQGVWEK